MNWKLGCLFFLVVGFLSQAQPVEPAKQSEKTYIIGLSDNPPISFINQSNQADGLIVDLLNNIAKNENFKIKWLSDEWDVLLTKIKDGKIDMLTSVGFSEKRTEFMDYSKEGFINSWSSIYLPQNSAIDNFLDLDNKTIALLTGDINGINLINRCAKFQINCKFIYVNTYTKLFETIANNQADAVVSNNIAGIWYANRYQIINSSIIFDPSLTFVSIPQDNDPYLLNLYDKYMREWKKNPESFYYNVKSKWLTSRARQSVSSSMLYTILGLSVFALLALFTAMIFKYEIKRRTKELSIRNEQFSQIINLVPHVIYVAEENGNILLANTKASQYFGMTSEEIDRCKIDNLKTNNSRGISFLNDNNLSKGIKETQLTELETSDYLENKYTLLLSKMPFKIAKDNPAASVTVAVDITDIKKYEQRIMQMAHYDALTELPNKLLFANRIKQSINQHIKSKLFGAVLSIDLDSFKDINDSQGHEIGDLLLKAVARRFEQNIKKKHVLSHFGGDEFVVDLPELDIDSNIAQGLAVEFAEFILNEIALPYEMQERVFQITASMGIVIYPRDAESVNVLMQRSDTAMNKAKQQGRNTWCLFDKKLELSVIKNHRLETELRQAVSQSQFEIVYQPIHANGNRIVGAEALLRWNHPTKGIIYPGEFIDAAEKIQLMVKIGFWVIEQACIIIRQNIDQGNPDYFIAVNVSVQQIKDVNFYDSIVEYIQQYNIPANHLELEITESVLMEDVELSIQLFNKLKLLGIRISIDDFGTGYSSFSYLVRLPIDKIKIDQSFVKNLPQNKNSATIVRTIIMMAKELEVGILAEGIETKEQHEFLIAEGCDFLQGFYLNKPMQYNKILKLKT